MRCNTWIKPIKCTDLAIFWKDLVVFACRFCPRGLICQASAPQTGGDIEVVTPEAEVVVSVLLDTRTVREEGSGTNPPGLNIRRPTLTMEALQWGRDSGDTWITMNRCQNDTLVFFLSHHHQRSWGQSQADSITPNSASATHSIRRKERTNFK